MTRRMFRSEKDRLIAGVCGGLGLYLDLDPTLVRVIFVILAFIGGSGLIAYLVLALIVPTESAVDRSAKEVVKDNVDEIGETARKIVRDVRDSFANGKGKKNGASAEGETEENDETLIPRRPEDFHVIKTRKIVAALILIVLGMIFLGHNFGLFWWFHWATFWPAALILIGLFLLIRR